MKKRRGNKRFYHKLRNWAETFTINFSDGEEYGFEHWHLWGDGRSDISGKHRRALMAILFTAFDRAIAQGMASSVPHQIWLNVVLDDLDMCALYVHTRNSTYDEFPYQFRGIQWDVKPPQVIAPFIDERKMQVGVYEGNRWYVVRQRNLTQ